MTAIAFDKFSSGLDLRKSADTAGADSLRVLRNAYVTTGHEIAKRPCGLVAATLEPGSVGLRAALGVLNTFYGTFGAVTHANALFVARFMPHPAGVATAVTKVHYCDVFNGYIYAVVEYANGERRHHYLDAGSVSATPKHASPAWTALTAYATTSPHYVTPTAPNGFRYECTTGGTSAAGQPVWPTAIGGTVVDGTVTWTCRSFVIVDTNCPQTASVAKVQGKLYAINGETVRYCATGSARDWSTASDAGFLATGINQTGRSTALAVAEFKDKIAVFFADGIQVWQADPDPALTILADKVFNTGCRFPGSIGQVSQDTFFLSDQGFRSVQLAVQSQELEDNDVGSPIDAAVRSAISDSLDPHTAWLSLAGQYVCSFNESLWTFTYSRTSKVSAWGEYVLPFALDDMTVLNGQFYVRDNDTVYRLDENTTQDGSTIPQVRIEFPYLDFKAPGVLKLIQGVDFVGEGQATIAYKYRAVDRSGNLTEHTTEAVIVTANSMPGVMTPVELCVTAIAPIITHQRNERFRLSRLVFYYQTLNAL